MPIYDLPKPTIFTDRRLKLIEVVKKEYGTGGVIVFWGAFEKPSEPFRQNSTFFYFTGIKEPASALIIDIDTQQASVFVPRYGSSKQVWASSYMDPALSSQYQKQYGIHALKFAGETVEGHSVGLTHSLSAYKEVQDILKQCATEGKHIYTLYSNAANTHEVDHQVMMMRCIWANQLLSPLIRDITHHVGVLRRKKDAQELEYMEQAIQITASAHLHALSALKPEYTEAVFQAMVEEYFIAAGALPAYPSIVAAGKAATVLHYNENNGEFKEGELLLVDIGAAFNGYASDTTRTYPISGTFSKRQKQLYTIVLETQEYVASLIKPGMWLKNKEKPEMSLYHHAVDFLHKKGGYDAYFLHGIGHYIGLDVHDIGSYNDPLQVGDIITIEPGIYIAEEKIGIRIEDMYQVTKEGSTCLTVDIPKSITEIEKIIMHLSAEDEEGDSCCDDEFCQDDE